MLVYSWIVIGVVCGAVAHLVLRHRGYELAGEIIVGIAAAAVAGAIGPVALGVRTGSVDVLSDVGLLCSLAGAVLALGVLVLLTPPASSSQRTGTAPKASGAGRLFSWMPRGLAGREALWFYVLIAPWLAGFLLFSGGPTIASAYLSFTHNDPVNWPPKWVGVTNYEVMLKDRLFWKALQVTSYYTVLVVPLSVGLATFIALLLNERIPGQSVWRTIYYLPAIVSGVPVAIMWAWIFQPQFGLVNGTLYSLTGIQGPRWLSDPSWTIPAFVMMSLWQFGGAMLIYLAAIQGVPTHLYESAQMDGANKMQQIWNITLPLISPVIFFNGIMAIIASFQVFTNSYVITQGGPNYATWFMVYMIYQNAFTYIANMGYADALSWVLFVIMLAFTYMAFRMSRNVVHYETLVR